jgi:hypothetical protein
LTSSNTAVARVLGDRLVTAVGPGTAEISATFQGRTSSVPMTVVPADRTCPYLSIEGLTQVRMGELHIVRARQYLQLPGDGPMATAMMDVTDLAAWTSSSPGVATVERGSVTATAVGTTQVMATFGGTSVTASVSVHPR